MKNSRCPYHVNHGMVDSQGKLVLSDVCGVRTAESITPIDVVNIM